MVEVKNQTSSPTPIKRKIPAENGESNEESPTKKKRKKKKKVKEEIEQPAPQQSEFPFVHESLLKTANKEKK